MFIDLLTLFVPAAVALAMFLSILATRRVRRDASFTVEQRSMQLWLIWLLPVAGAALVLAMLHEEPRAEFEHNSDTRQGGG
jgi:hypothetical protein